MRSTVFLISVIFCNKAAALFQAIQLGGKLFERVQRFRRAVDQLGSEGSDGGRGGFNRFRLRRADAGEQRGF